MGYNKEKHSDPTGNKEKNELSDESLEGSHTRQGKRAVDENKRRGSIE